MADNTLINLSTVVGGDTIATEDIGGVKYELVKVVFGLPGIATKVSATNPLPVTDSNTAKEFGTWGYNAGASGTVILAGGKRVIGITAHSTAGGTIAINGGDSFPVVALTGITITPKGNIVNPTIVLVGTDSYFIEFVS